MSDHDVGIAEAGAREAARHRALAQQEKQEIGQMISPRLTLAGVCLAALTLAACGGDDPEDVDVVEAPPAVEEPAPAVEDPAPGLDAAPPAMDAAPPAMDAAPPAMDAAPPAMDAAPPADAPPADAAAPDAGAPLLPEPESPAPAPEAAVGEGLLSLFDVTGIWAADAAACDSTERFEVRATMLITPDQECDIVRNESVDGGVQVTLSCPAGAAAAGAEEIWRITATDDARPANMIEMALAPDFVDPLVLVRCQ